MSDNQVGAHELDPKARSDAYYRRSRSLLKSGEQLAAMTGCHVKFQTIPTWSKGKKREFTSPGFPADRRNRKSNDVGTSTADEQDEVGSPARRQAEVDVCGVCKGGMGHLMTYPVTGCDAGTDVVIM